MKTNKMQIKIRSDINKLYNGNNDDLNNWLKRSAGKWVNVEIDHLFTDQYNTSKYRLFDGQVSAVRNDARKDKGKCKWCGKMVNTGEKCGRFEECDKYGIEWFTPKNTFFLQYPNGIKKPDPLTFPDDKKEIKIGTYTLEQTTSGLYRLSNCRQTINFKFKNNHFYTYNEIGFKEKKYLPVPFKVHEKLIKLLSPSN